MATFRSDLDRLVSYIRAGRSAITIHTHEERDALELVRTAAVMLGRPVWEWSSTRGVRDSLLANAEPVPNTENTAAGLHYLAINHAKDLCVVVDSGAHLAEPRKLRALRDLIAAAHANEGCAIVIEHDPALLPAVVRAHATPFTLSLPSDEDLRDIIKATVQRAHRRSPLTIELSNADLSAIIANLRGLSRRQAEQVIISTFADDRRLDAHDIAIVAAEKRRILHVDGLLEFVEAPHSLDEVGGLSRLKAWLLQRERAFRDDARSFGIDPPRGVLLLGVQGAGKSLSAKAIATAWKRPLLRLDPGALYDRYVGESERRLRESLKQAEAMAPIVLWIDEIEKGFASASHQSNDGGLSQRMFGALLTWMQEHNAPVFLVATANNIDALPPELLRKGRFDEIFFVDLPSAPARRTIFQIHLTKRKRDSNLFDLDRLASASDGYSGAEIEQAIVSAMHGAFASGAQLNSDHILAALRESPPLSVTMRERIADLRAWADGRCVPAD
jgi:SpoVK/Ycf46/Vps4 family AAA+-type ATPase